MGNDDKPTEGPGRELDDLLREVTELQAPAAEGDCVEGALRRTEKMLSRVLSSSPVATSYVEQGKLRWVNQAMAEMFGEFNPAGWSKRRPREYCATEQEYQRVREAFFKGTATGKPAEAEARLRRADGSEFYGHLKMRPLDPSDPPRGTITTISDISDRKRAEQSLRDSEERYRLLAQNSLMGIYIHQDGKFVYINERLAEILGHPVDEVIGRDFWEFVHPHDRRTVKERGMARSLGKPAPPHYEFRVVTRAGEVRWMELLATTIWYHGRTANMGNVADITDRKRAEQALHLEKQKFQDLSEHAPFGMLLINELGSSTYMNSKFTEITGYALEEIPNLETWFKKAFPNPQDRSEQERIWAEDLGRARSGEKTARLVTVTCKDGTRKTVSCIPVQLHTGEYLVTCQDVTDRIRAEDLLRQTEDRYRTLVEESFDGIYVRRGDTIVFVNSRLCSMLNRSASDLRGADHRIIFHPHYQELMRKRALARLRGEELPNPFQVKLLRADGTAFDGEVSAREITFGGESAQQVCIRDLTDRKKAEEELRRRERIYRTLYEQAKRTEEVYHSLLNSIPDAIVIYDTERRARYVNDSFTRMFGWTMADVEGQIISNMPDSEREATMRLISDCIERGIPYSNFETKRFTKDGDLLDVNISASRFNDHEGKPAGMLVILRDITEAKRAENLLLQTERMKAVGEMASGVAHNFNNLLQILMNRALLALRHLDSQGLHDSRVNLERILESCEFGSETVKRLQDFARVRIHKTDEAATVFDLSRTVEKAVEMGQHWWKTNPEREGIKISLEKSFVQDALVRGSEHELFEVAVNLIKNAAEALPQGGRIGVSTFVDGDTVFLQVRDNGVGIPERNRGKVFEPFWTTKGRQGTGMGLASSLGIVTRHQGDIVLESQEGRGTVVTVRLPRSARWIEKRDTIPSAEWNVSLKILVTDDAEQAVSLLQEGLGELGHEVFGALSGQEALELYKQIDVDVIICDLGMPRMNGWQVGRAVKEICEARGIPKTPFILLTGWGGQLDESDKIAESGVDRIVEKPVHLDTLMQVIKEVLEDGLH